MLRVNFKNLFYNYICSISYCILLICGINNQQAYAKSSPTDTITLQLKWKNQFQFAGYYAANIKGFYSDKGLHVKILPGGLGISVIDQLLQGKADIGIFDPGILSRAKATESLIVLATIMQSSGYCIISLKEKNILKPSDLVGKRVLVESTQGWGIFKAILLKEGINTDSINVIERVKDSEEILNNTADAVVTYISSQPQKFAARGKQINIIRPEEYGVDFYGDVLLSTKKFVYADEKQTNSFIKATSAGWKYALAHEDEMIDYILTLDDVKAEGVTRKHLKYEANQIRKLIMPQLVEIGHTNLGRWQYMLKIFQELGIADKSLSLKGFIYDTENEHKARWYLPAVYASIAILLIVVAVALVNQQLRKRIKISTIKLTDEIEQRKEAEHLANENKEQIELILNSSNIGLWELEIETKKTIFNSRFKAVLGYREDYNLLLEDFCNKIHPEDLKTAQHLFCIENLNIPTRIMTQFRVENAQGQYIYVLSSSKIILKNHKPFKISGILLSIEELKQKELEVLKVSDELIRRNNELKKFAYITSHNIRGPIVNISSLAQMMDQNSLDKENAIIFENMSLSIQKLENVLDDLVELVAHDRSGNSSLEKININETVQSVLDTIQQQNPNNKLDINLNLKINELMLPKHALLSIVLNLITNSIKFKASERALVISIEAFEDENNSVLKFTDNGIGIELLKYKHKIFNLYQRIDQNIEGKGIGLFVVKSHMDALNGRIEIDSTPNIGTSFTLYFPKPHFS